MTKKLGWLARAVAMFALGLTFAGASLAQTTSTDDARTFEVISVDGNQLVFRDERGTNTITVPDGFRFTVDGKQLAIGDLKPGMKGTAVVTTTTTVTPVTITEIKKGVVVSVGPSLADREGRGRRRPQAVHAGPVERPGHQDHQGRQGDPRQRREAGRRADGDDRLARCAGGGDGTGSAGDAGSGDTDDPATPAPTPAATTPAHTRDPRRPRCVC